MTLISWLTLLLANTGIAIADRLHPGLFDINANTGYHSPSLHILVARQSDPHWNQTYVDNQRSFCGDQFASQQCCPGYCAVDYRTSHTNLYYTCCPRGYYAAVFGSSGDPNIECCAEGTSPCEKGNQTKKAVMPFKDATRDVVFLEQHCSEAPILGLQAKMLIVAALALVLWNALV
jgi:hypothetical protein